MSDAVSELRSLARNLRTMGVGTHLTRPIATRLSSLTIRSYRAQEAPDGSNWAAGKYASRPMLQKSRALIGSLTPTVGTAKVGLKFGTKYGWYHQHGAQLRGRKPSGPMQRRTRSGPVRAGERRSVYQQRRQGAELRRQHVGLGTHRPGSGGQLVLEPKLPLNGLCQGQLPAIFDRT